ncbi:glycosyltransferase [Cesiribacter andamanensis]|uniref:Glycogen synthase n=1 Tax=Cesiribacter andamanensis AMV16 TaxID=1279009 RepID=M7NPB7_9BACT|nr:glycosyltransferase [Cesiribacter andamanensis]EMR03570.1 Glycogen synthase [Cesiribacter andamanensis AMV16]
MNIFIIPSWYPSESNPHAGIFTKEQVIALAKIFPEHTFALSHWGQNEEKFLLWAKDHIHNLKKVYSFYRHHAQQLSLAPNFIEYYTPALTWSRTFLKGNMKRIVQINKEHLLAFRKNHGDVAIIHAHTSHPAGWVAMELSKLYRIPYVITEHMSPFPFTSYLTKSGKIDSWLKMPLLCSSCNIMVSPQQKEKLSQLKIPNLTYIPNLTDESFFTPVENLGATAGFHFFTLGRLEAQKGIPYLLEAIRRLKVANIKVLFRIGGEGSEKEAYQQLAKHYELQDTIQWLGVLSREQVAEEMRACQAFVLPSMHENLPMVILEAIACGKPVITTACGGPESIIHQHNGIVVPAGDSEALTRALIQFLTSVHEYESETIRQDFLQRYSRQVVCQQILEVYCSAISEYRK